MTAGIMYFTIGACVWLICTPRINTGVFLTTGLACVAISAIIDLAPESHSDVCELRTVGIGLALAGGVWRLGIRPAWLRLSNVWKAAHTAAKVFGIERRHWSE